MNTKNKKLFFIKLSIIIICLYYNDSILSYIDYFISYIKIKNDINNFERFFKFCEDNIKIIKKFNIKVNPKVSIISPIYNRERFLIRFLKSIQHQSFNDIEIILIDDNSTDNGFKILEEYQKEDKRIKLIKNKRNKGTFITRNIGVLYSKGKYVFLPDPDDLLSKDIIRICLSYAEKYKFEMIRYDSYRGNKHKIKLTDIKKKILVYQPELQTYLFYGKNELNKIDSYVNNKMIKKELFIKALNSLNNFYLNVYMTLLEDQLILFILYKTAKSFYYLRKYGYYYKVNTISICFNEFKLSIIKMKFYFMYLKLLYEYSKNIKYEKDMANYQFTLISKHINIERELSSTNFNDDFDFYYEIVNMLLNCKFISEENNFLLLKIKKLIEIKNKTFVNSKKITNL